MVRDVRPGRLEFASVQHGWVLKKYLENPQLSFKGALFPAGWRRDE